MAAGNAGRCAGGILHQEVTFALTKNCVSSIILAAVNAAAYGSVAQLGERTVRIREVRGFDPLQIHQRITVILIQGCGYFLFMV